MDLIVVSEHSAQKFGNTVYPSGTQGAQLKIVYDDSWVDCTKTVCFSNGECQKDDVTQNEIVDIPNEMFVSPNVTVKVGFYGVHPDGSVTPTIWTTLCRVPVGTDPCGDESTEGSLPVYAQMLQQIGQLPNLNTKCKHDLVCAINEVLSSVGLQPEDIVDNLVDGGSDKVLSAEQGKVLKGLVDEKQPKTFVVNVSYDDVPDKTNAEIYDAYKQKCDIVMIRFRKTLRISGKPSQVSCTFRDVLVSESGVSNIEVSIVSDKLYVNSVSYTPSASETTATLPSELPEGTDTNVQAILDILADSYAKVMAFLDSDDQTLDQLTELIAAIKENKTTIDSLMNDKVNVADIVNDLVTGGADKVLSAEQGKALKKLIDDLDIPNVPEWAMQPTKPEYTANEVGAIATSELQNTINKALDDAKRTGLFDGEDGVTPNLSIGTVETLEPGSKATATITGSVTNLKLNLGIPKGTDSVPKYAVTEAERVVSAVQSKRTSDTLVLSAMSDWHLSADGPQGEATRNSALLAAQGLTEIHKRMAVDCDLRLGDYTWGAADWTASMAMRDIQYVRSMLPSSEHEIWMCGNHDVNYGKNRDRTLTSDEIYAYIASNSRNTVIDYSNPGGAYGLRDFWDQHIRIIYLNTCDAFEERAIPEIGINAPSEWLGIKQSKWVGDVALDFSDKTDPSSWGVIFVSHHPINYGFTCFTQFIRMLEAYKDKKSGEINYAVDGKSYSYKYDFTSRKPAKILCAINGHSHNERTDYVSSGAGVSPWLLRVTVPNICDSRYNEAGANGGDFGKLYGEFGPDGLPVYHRKEPGTEKGTSFFILSIDRKVERLRCNIFGAGVDIDLPFTPEAIGPTYTNLIPESKNLDLVGIYNGKGFKENTYISGAASGADSSGSGTSATGMMPISLLFDWPNNELGYAIVRFKNIRMSKINSHCRFCAYDANGARIGFQDSKAFNVVESLTGDLGKAGVACIVDSSGSILEFDPGPYLHYIHRDLHKDVAYFRISAEEISESSVVTVNERIVI